MVTAIVITILGVLSVLKLPIEQYPDITPPMVEVSASYLGADATTVQQAVATPLAQNINGVNDMLYMQATNSNDGSMSLQVTFDIGTDPDMNAVITQNRVSAATPLLPEAVTRQGVTTNKTMSSFLFVISLYSDGQYDGNFLANYAVLNIQNELERIEGVGKVSIMGAGEYAMRIWLLPDKLNYLGVTIDEVTQAIDEQSAVLPGGKFGAEPSPAGTEFTYTVRMPAQLNTPEEFRNIIVRTAPDGSQVRLGDVARVELGSQTYEAHAAYDRQASAVIAVYQAPGSNAVELGKRVKEELRAMSEKFPEGMHYTVIVDATKAITLGIHDIVVTLIIALLLVIFVIYLFIQDVRATLIPLIAIPVSLVGAFMLFPLLGFTINVFSLLGLVLAIGLVVDDAIVVVEAVQVNIEAGMTPKRAATEAMRTVSSPIVATTLVLVAVFVPVAFMGGVSGRLYQQFAITIAFSVILSAFNALTLSPALCSLLMRSRRRTPRRNFLQRFFARFNRGYERTQTRYLRFTAVLSRHAARSLVFVGILVAAVLVLFRLVPGGFLPEEDQGYIMVNVQLPDAASLQRTERAVASVEAVVRSNEAVAGVTTVSGFNLLSGTLSSNSGVLFVLLKDWNQRSVTASELVAELNEKLYFIINSGQVYALGPPAIPGLGVGSGFTIMLQDRGGRGTEYLAGNAARFVEAAHKRPEIASVTLLLNENVPQRALQVDREMALKMGVPLSALHNAISTYLGGAFVNNFTRFGRLYQTYMQAGAEYRQNQAQIGRFFVENVRGERIPLSTFITVVDTVGPAYTTQFNLYPSAEVTGSATRGYSSAETMKALEEVAAEVLPADMGYAWSGMSYQESRASGTSYLAFLYAAVFVYLILAALYESWSLPLTVILGIPFAVFGSMLFIFLAHLLSPTYVNNIFLQISLIMLIGLAAKNAILIIEYAKDEFDAGRSVEDSALYAAKARLRPILMTAFAFILGVAPLIWASGANALARNVMGVALVGGMFVATLIGVFLYPVFFVMIARMGHYVEKRERRLREEAAPEAAAPRGQLDPAPVPAQLPESTPIQLPESFEGESNTQGK